MLGHCIIRTHCSKLGRTGMRTLAQLPSRKSRPAADLLAPSKPFPVPPGLAVSRGLDLSEIPAHAVHGLSGPGTALPHGAAIQRSFGQHDVSDVRAHVAGPAAHASHAIGAAAYAVGDRVAFGATPDLRTAAHEAAHVVQQRAGVDVA